MILIPDVNVLIYAFTSESPRHPIARDWLAETLAGDDSLGVSDLVLSGVVRIMSSGRASWANYDADDLLDRCDALRRAHGVVPVQPGANHWRIFGGLVRVLGASGTLVPDCYHAALAIEHGATWVSGDSFFARVPGLRWLNPFS